MFIVDTTCYLCHVGVVDVVYNIMCPINMVFNTHHLCNIRVVCGTHITTHLKPFLKNQKSKSKIQLWKTGCGFENSLFEKPKMNPDFTKK
jgi:hypothetical protein